jgi:uncharacterized protein YjbI with pentapeptide repeats
VKQTHLK